MKCSEIEKKLVFSEMLTSAESEHVQSCPNCTAFLQDVELLRSTRDRETPTHLKSRTLMMSLQQLERPSQQESHLSYFQKLWQTSQAALILAGFSILALIVTILYQINCDQTDVFCRIAALFLIIILAQNIVAVLCAPVLIQHKNILHYK